MKKENFRIFQAPHTASRIVDGEAIVVNLQSKMAFVLNAVATRIWELAEEGVFIDEMVRIIQEEFEVEGAQDLAGDIYSFIQEGLRIGILERKEVNLDG
jgi:hypothetical protein